MRCEPLVSVIFMVLLILNMIIYGIPASSDETNQFEVTSTRWENQSGQVIDVTGGDEAYLTISIRQSNPKNIEFTRGNVKTVLNKRPVAISGITVELLDSDWFVILGEQKQSIDTAVPVGNTFTVRFYVGLKDDVSPGIYSGKIRVSYTLAYDGDVWYVVNEQETLDFNITVTGRPDIKVYLNGELQPGTTNNITVKIKNAGDAIAKKIKVSLSTQAPVDISPDEEQIEKIVPGESISLNFNVVTPYNYLQPTTTFTISVEYMSPSNTTMTLQSTRNIVREQYPRDYPLVQTTLKGPSALLPGESYNYELEITNYGYSTAYDLTLDVFSQQASIVFPSSLSRYELEPNQTITLPLIISIPTNIYESSIILQSITNYRDKYGQAYQLQDQYTIKTVDPYSYQPIIVTSLFPKGELIPGNRTLLFLSLENHGSTPAYNVSLVISSQFLGILYNDSFIDKIEPNKTVYLPIEVEIPRNSKGQVATINVQVTFNTIFGDSIVRSNVFSFKISDKLVKPIIVLETPERLYLPTGESSITIYIKNMGDSPAYNMKIKINGVPGVSIISSPVKFIDYLDVSSREELKFEVSVSSPGEYNLNLYVEYYDYWNNYYTDTFTIGLRAEEKPTTNIEVNPLNDTLNAGQLQNISVVLSPKNGIAKDLWINAYSSSLNLIGSPTRYISVLNRSLIVNFPVYVIDKLVGSNVQLVLNLEYIDSEGFRKAKEYTLSFLVVGKIVMELLDYTVSPKTPYPGQEIGVSLSLVNRGTDKAKSLITYIVNTSSLVLIGGNKTYIGDVDVGSIVPISFSLLIPNETVPGSYEISIVLEYKDSYDHLYKKEVPLYIDVYEKPVLSESSAGRIGNSYLILAVLVGIILILLLVAILRRRT